MDRIITPAAPGNPAPRTGYQMFVVLFEQYLNTHTDETWQLVYDNLCLIATLISRQERLEVQDNLMHLKGFNGSGVTSWDTVIDIVNILQKHGLCGGLSLEEID